MNVEVRMDKPATIQSDLGNLPAVFWPYRDLRIWCLWSWVLVNDRWTKPPFQPNGSHAKSQGEDTWCTYAEAFNAVQAGRGDGIGIMLFGMKQAEIIFDIDHCRDITTGKIDAWAQEIIDEAASYTEVTPSGTGVRVLGHGDIGRVHRRFSKVNGKDGGVEVYTAGEARYITVTGLQVPGCWPVVSNIAAVAQRLIDNKGHLHPQQPTLQPQPSLTAKDFEPAPAYQPKTGSLGLMLGRDEAGELDQLIRHGVPQGQRSEQFYRAVGLAKRLQWTPETLERTMRSNPAGIASKYLMPDRLTAEIARAWGKVEEPVVSAQEWAAATSQTTSAAAIAAGSSQPVAISSPWDEPPEAIPAREWIIRGLMIRRHISILVAPGGSGKSLLSAQWAIALALGMSWAGWTPVEAQKVLLINAEDDGDEMRRRIHAACKVMNVDPRSLIGRLFLADDPRSIVVAKTTKDKIVTATPLADAIRKTVADNGIGVVVVDPFAETFEGDENSNSEVKWAAAIWRAVARETSCSVMLVHHTPKYAKGMAGDADAARGAGALVNSARIVSTLFTMTEEEAGLFSLKPDEAHRYVRFDDAKANLTLMTGKARWFEKVSHELPNGDSVGVLKPWKPPGVFDGVSIETITGVLQTLDQGRDGGKYLYNYNAGNVVTAAWAGYPIMEATGCERDKAAKMLKEWADSGLLVKAEYTSENRHAKVGVRVDFSKRPGEI